MNSFVVQQSYKLEAIILPILQMRKLQLREVTSLVQGHSARLPNRDSNPSLSDSKACARHHCRDRWVFSYDEGACMSSGQRKPEALRDLDCVESTRGGSTVVEGAEEGLRTKH